MENVQMWVLSRLEDTAADVEFEKVFAIIANLRWPSKWIRNAIVLRTNKQPKTKSDRSKGLAILVIGNRLLAGKSTFPFLIHWGADRKAAL